MPSLPPRQLTMVIDRAAVNRLPDVSLPDGYVIRAARPADIGSWAGTLQAGGFERWNEEQVREYLQDPERREGSRVVEQGGRVVAGTFASRIEKRLITADDNDEGGPEEAILDFVVTHPDHRGMGLGRAACTEVSRFFVARGYETVSLGTDDWRLSAIHVYLSLGYRPIMSRSDMPSRWAAVFENLKEGGRDHT